MIYVGIGGAIGAIFRYLTTLAVPFPYGTLTVNVVGSFAMGVLLVLIADKGFDRWQPLLMTGVLGGFTTFSAFSLDTLRLWESGQVGMAFGYVLASVLFSLFAVFAAVVIARGMGL